MRHACSALAQAGACEALLPRSLVQQQWQPAVSHAGKDDGMAMSMLSMLGAPVMLVGHPLINILAGTAASIAHGCISAVRCVQAARQQAIETHNPAAQAHGLVAANHFAQTASTGCSQHCSWDGRREAASMGCTLDACTSLEYNPPTHQLHHHSLNAQRCLARAPPHNESTALNVPAMVVTDAQVHFGSSGGGMFACGSEISNRATLLGLITSNARHASGVSVPRIGYVLPVDILQPILRVCTSADGVERARDALAAQLASAAASLPDLGGLWGTAHTEHKKAVQSARNQSKL